MPRRCRMGAVGPMSRSRMLLIGWLAFLAVGVSGSHAAVSQTIYAWLDVDGNLNFRYVDNSSVGSTVPPGTYQIVLNNNTADIAGSARNENGHGETPVKRDERCL